MSEALSDSTEIQLHESAEQRLQAERDHERQRILALGKLGLTELNHRSADGMEVSLLWSRRNNSLMVAVRDTRLGESFEVPAPADKAMDVFNHPFGYAA